MEIAPRTHERNEDLPRGTNVEIVYMLTRHGERNGDALIDLGRDITRTKARTSDVQGGDFDAVKAIGSDAGVSKGGGAPVEQAGAMKWDESRSTWIWDKKLTRTMGRSLETAHIFATEIPGATHHVSRSRQSLNYEHTVTPPPYDHLEIYNQNLPEGFDELTGKARVEAAKKAQDAVMAHAYSIDTPEARQWREETAGGFAAQIEWYAQMAKRLDGGSRVLLPAGTHGGTMELLLQQALVWADAEGVEHTGFSSAEEIGGGFSPSESFRVHISTDSDGNIEEFHVFFDNAERPEVQHMHLDAKKIRALAATYRGLQARAKNAHI